MKTTVKQFEEQVTEQIRKRVMGTKKPFPAGKIAMVNHEDNFIHYFV